MDYFPNSQCMVDFCAQTLPLLRARRPGIKLAIVGADPVPAVRRLAEIPGVTVTGSVKDVRPHVRRAALTVAPLVIARGTQNKILESLAMGVPSPQRGGAKGVIRGGEHMPRPTPGGPRRRSSAAGDPASGGPSRGGRADPPTTRGRAMRRFMRSSGVTGAPSAETAVAASTNKR
jgi:hypothetical protein